MKTSIIYFLIISLLSVSCGRERSRKYRERSRPFPTEACYVDGIRGDDNYTGNKNKPIKTIAELNLRLQKKASSVYFTSGQVFNGTLIFNGINGPYKISSLGGGRAVINGGNSEAIKIENCRNIWITNLDLKGNGRKEGNITNGLSLTHSQNMVIDQIYAAGFQKSGVDMYDCKEIKVNKVTASNNGFSGINVMGSERSHSGKIMISYCKAENNPGDPVILDNHSGNGILVGVSDSVLIDHCTATNNGWDMPRQGNGPVGIWTWESSHVTIQYCISYKNKTSKGGKDGGGFDLDGGVTNSVIQYCLSFNNQGAGYGLFQYSGASNWSGNVVRHCISINDATTTEGSGSIFLWNGSGDDNQLADCKVYSNIAFNSHSPVISYENASAHKNFTFRNNIFIGTGKAEASLKAGSSFIRNWWWDTKSKKD